MSAPVVETLFVGKVKKMGMENATDPMDKPWESGMFKESVTGKIWLGRNGLSGDEVADTKNHGGPEKAIFAYPAAHYREWRKEPKLAAISAGSMGENLSVTGCDESTVCIGDIYKFGNAVIQVSQPRRPCWKPARRFRLHDFALRIQESGLTGWYFRVLKEGYVQGNEKLLLRERPCPRWSIAKCNEVMYGKKDDFILAEELASCELLAANWKESLRKRLAGEEAPSDKRVFGPNKE